MLEAGFWDQQELVQRTTREMSALKRSGNTSAVCTKTRVLF